MNEFFASDGTLINFMTKVGQLILLGLLWLLCSLPVVTMGAASAALYYSVVKSVRRGRGYPAREFFRAFKKNLPKGIIFTIFFLTILLVVLYNRQYVSALLNGEVRAKGLRPLGDGGDAVTLYLIYDAVLLLCAVEAMYLFPVISRFEMSALRQAMLAFVMAVRYFYYTLLLVVGFVLLLWLQYRVLPIVTAALLPGVWTWGASQLIERVMKRYYPKDAGKDTNGGVSGEADGGVDAWWLE